jgi:predicted cupin superfamily sugar epimerase
VLFDRALTDRGVRVASSSDVIKLLGLSPLPGEGGYFRETYRSSLKVNLGEVEKPSQGERRLGTSILYLVTEGNFSALHRLKFDEIFHFYLGDPVEMVKIGNEGGLEKVTLGPDLFAGHRVQEVVRAGIWQGTSLLPGGSWALLGTTMSVGFEFSDFELGTRASLLSEFPDHRREILKLTRE